MSGWKGWMRNADREASKGFSQNPITIHSIQSKPGHNSFNSFNLITTQSKMIQFDHNPFIYSFIQNPINPFIHPFIHSSLHPFSHGYIFVHGAERGFFGAVQILQDGGSDVPVIAQHHMSVPVHRQNRHFRPQLDHRGSLIEPDSQLRLTFSLLSPPCSTAPRSPPPTRGRSRSSASARSYLAVCTHPYRYVTLCQIRRDPSSLPDTMIGSFGWKRTAVMFSVWPSSVWMHVFV